MKFASNLKILAVALAMGAASIVAPTSAQAGIGSSIKGAAKSVGGAVKKTATGVGSVVKKGAVLVAKDVKQAGVVAGKLTGVTVGVKGASAAVKAIAQGKVKWR
jgi:hypothetical protein